MIIIQGDCTNEPPIPALGMVGDCFFFLLFLFIKIVGWLSSHSHFVIHKINKTEGEREEKEVGMQCTQMARRKRARTRNKGRKRRKRNEEGRGKREKKEEEEEERKIRKSFCEQREHHLHHTHHERSTSF